MTTPPIPPQLPEHDPVKQGRSRRAFLLLGLELALFGGLGARLYHVQVNQHRHYHDLAQRQHTPLIPLPCYRGDIRFRDGSVAARSIRTPSLYAEPANMKDPLATVLELAPILELDERGKQRLLRRFQDSRYRHFCWVQRRLSHQQAEAVEALDLPGLGFRNEYRRIHPYDHVAAHVVGLVDIDGEGRAGVESRFNHVLSGVQGIRKAARDGLGRTLVLGETYEVPPRHGFDVELTIDRHIQSYLEEALDATQRRWKPEGLLAVVMDPWTGDILALGNRPTFDPGALDGVASGSFRNRSVTDQFEPGSVLKPLVLAAALQQGTVQPSDSIFCENGAWRVRGGRWGRTLHDAGHRFGTLSIADILIRSSNIGMAKIGTRMGGDQLRQAITDLGFGTPTGIELDGEVGGTVTSVTNGATWKPDSTISVSFGQEIAVTAVQLAASYATLANGGTLVKPRIVQRILDEHGRVFEEVPPRAVRRVFDRGVCRTVTQMMVGVTEDEHGTGKQARIEGIPVAGKTGTAWIGGRRSLGYNAAFAAFAPADRPRLVALVIAIKPQGAHYGGTVSAPAVKDILHRSLAYLSLQDRGRLPRLSDGEPEVLRPARQ